MAYLIALFIFLSALPVFAAGRVSLQVDHTSAPAGTPIEVNVKLLQGDASDSDASTGEKAEIKIRDAKDGQSCTTDPAPSDSSGIVRGSCTSSEEGSMIVYATSKDRADSSEDITLEFTKKEEPTPTVDPSKKNQTSQQMPGQGSALANQPGLAEEQEKQPLAPGLARDDELVAGAADTADTPAAPATNDIDLLTSLIFLTGGIILLIGVVYIIFLQARKYSEKKKKPDITPPPAAS